MQKLPVTELRDALMLQAGVFFDQFRFCLQLGKVMLVSQALVRLDIQLEGRSRGNMWMIDGFRTQSLTINARDAGGSFMNINSLAIKEIQILSGGFTAEYGNAQSGVVNVIMKEGQNKLEGGLQISYSHQRQRHFGNYLYDPETQKEYKDHMIGLFYDDSLMTFYQDTAFLYFDTTSGHYIDTKYISNYDGDIDSVFFGEPYLDPYWMSDYRTSQIYDYRTIPDYNIIATLGGPLPIFKNDWTFQLSGQLKKMAYTLPNPEKAEIGTILIFPYQFPLILI